MRNLIGYEKYERTGGRRQLHNEKLHNVYTLPQNIMSFTYIAYLTEYSAYLRLNGKTENETKNLQKEAVVI